MIIWILCAATISQFAHSVRLDKDISNDYRDNAMGTK